MSEQITIDVEVEFRIRLAYVLENSMGLEFDFDLDPVEELVVVESRPWTAEQIAAHRERAAKDCAG